VSAASLKLWVSRTGFGKNQALGYKEFLKLCERLIEMDPMEAGSRVGTAKGGGKERGGGGGKEEGGDVPALRYTSSWDHLTYEDMGKMPVSADSEVHFPSTSVSQDDAGDFQARRASTASRGQATGAARSGTGNPGIKSSASVPYLISRRKAAAASLFS
jgi:hypothetical protein